MSKLVVRCRRHPGGCERARLRAARFAAHALIVLVAAGLVLAACGVVLP